jgi:1-phosphatidylinositol phosphodiesterase
MRPPSIVLLFALSSLLHASCADVSDANEVAALTTALSAGPTEWMAGLDDALLLSQLTIPGTHETMALYEPFPGTTRCQDLTLAEQLRAGVRFIDIRCRHIDNAFAIHHEQVYQHANFDDVLGTVGAFLREHPSETVIMSVREEYTPDNVSRSFEETFDAYVARDPALWNLDPGIPTLKAARGKITLFRRFSGRARGIDAAVWPDNTTFTTSILRVQDNYRVGSTGTKWNQVRGMLDEARTGNPRTLYVNFSSGSVSVLGIPNIPTVADSLDSALYNYLGSASGRFGIIPMDFVDAELVARVYGTNGRFVALRSYNFPDGYITARSDSGVYQQAGAGDESDYQVVPGLADSSCVSFRSRRYPERYLRHANYLLWLNPDSGGPFRADATFCARPALNGDPAFRSFESLNFPGHYVRHASGRVRIAPYEGSALYGDDASWQYTPR